MPGKLIVLGCGGSAGVPTIGNWWGDCDPSEPKNYRTRCSVALQTDDTLLIIDTGPDFREQMNREKLGCPDAVLFTHEHSDHVNGIDELRTLQRLNGGRKFPIYSDESTITKLLHRFDYMFANMENGFYPSVCEANAISMNAPMTLGDITFTPFMQDHGTIDSIGLRIGKLGYSTDVKRLGDTAIDILKGIDTWLVDGAGHHSRTNPVHASIEEVIEMNEKIGAKRVILNHLPPTMDYKTLLKELPEGYEPAYDGLTLDFV